MILFLYGKMPHRIYSLSRWILIGVVAIDICLYFIHYEPIRLYAIQRICVVTLFFTVNLCLDLIFFRNNLLKYRIMMEISINMKHLNVLLT